MSNQKLNDPHEHHHAFSANSTLNDECELFLKKKKKGKLKPICIKHL